MRIPMRIPNAIPRIIYKKNAKSIAGNPRTKRMLRKYMQQLTCP
jgi:hypothetical protein